MINVQYVHVAGTAILAARARLVRDLTWSRGRDVPEGQDNGPERSEALYFGPEEQPARGAR